jgi:FlaG/FlaF family flagellin (archaellin)
MSENEQSGVSPVIGIILMVGISVALVALASTIVFDISGNGDESSAGHSVDIEPDPQSDSIITSVSRNPDLERVFVRGDGINGEQQIVSSKGETGTATISPSSTEGTVEIVGVTEDGDEQILDTKEYEGFSGSGLGKTSNNIGITGIVKVNPPIDGATVKAVRSDGTVAATTTTDTSGEYSFGIPQQQIAEVVVNVEGADELSNPLYVSGVKPATSGEVNFDFDESSRTTTDVDGDGSDESIIFETDSSGNKLIGNAFQLQQMSNDVSASYKIINDIDASVTSSWNGGNGFNPVATGSDFTGTLDGQGHTIKGLTINRPNDEKVGLFEKVDTGARIENVGLVNVDVTGKKRVGGLVGDNSGFIGNSFADGSVSAGDSGIGDVGLLVGLNDDSINNSNTSGTVDVGTIQDVGGLVGENGGSINSSNSSATVNSGGEKVGGLVGFNNNAQIDNSFATGDVTTTNSSSFGVQTGGLVGQNGGSDITNSYATGDVSGNGKNVGGLIGDFGSGSVENTYATGDVSSSGATGGLIGKTFDTSDVDSTGSYWDTLATGQSTSAGGDPPAEGGTGANPLTTGEMQGSSASTNMDEFDFTNNWSTVSGDYPELKFQE